MHCSVIVTIFNSFSVKNFAAVLVVLVFLSVTANAQNVDEIVPFETLLLRNVELKPELKGVHPRLFFNAAEMADLRKRAQGKDKQFWKEAAKNLRILKRNAPDPKDAELYKSGLEQKSGSISQYSVAFAIAEGVFAYKFEQDEKYLQAVKAWTLAVCEMPMWGYTYNKPNVDLPPAHLLYAVGFAYDQLFDKFTASEKDIIRAKLVRQGRLMYEYFKFKKGKRYTYNQNHTWIPMAGLAIAAYAIMDEVEEAKDWAKLSRAVFDRMIQVMGTDGYFYEGFHYFGFAFRWVIRYFDAHLAATGEDLYAALKPKLAGMKYYAMHSVLPDGKNVFDFGDVGDGSLNRTGKSERENLFSEYEILYRLAAVYKDGQAQTVGDYLRDNTDLETREPVWAFVNRDPNLQPVPLSQIPLSHHFVDNGTVYWRSSWGKDATAFAFRAAPPEGHHAARLAAKISDWRQNSGHAHPDANSFIIWAHGKYLTGDTGYLGIKQTDDHNTILVNGRGQEKDGVYEMFKGVPNDRLDKIRIEEFRSSPEYFYVRGEASSGYYSDLGLQNFKRHFLFIAPNRFVVWDELKTDKPSEFSFLLNTDGEVKIDRNDADLINGNVALRVVRVAPADARTEAVAQMIQARGLPGSVDKGDSEQRGMQLRSNAKAETASFDFIHFLQPYLLADKASLLKVSALGNGRKGLVLESADGEKDTIIFDDKKGIVVEREIRQAKKISTVIGSDQSKN